MKRSVALCFSLLVCNFFSFSQFKIIAESPEFTRPMWTSQFLQLHNGNTAIISLKKADIEIVLYGKEHKVIASVTYTPAGTLKSYGVNRIYEIKGDIVFFISGYEGNAALLHIIIFDGSTGKVKDERTIARTAPGKGMLNTAMLDPFEVKKDPRSDNYAVGVFNVFGEDKSKAIEIIQFDGNHAVINSTYLDAGNEEAFPFFICMDMVVIGAETVHVFLYNGKQKYRSMRKKGRIVMASVNSKQPGAKIVSLGLPENNDYEACYAGYVSSANKIYLVVEETRSKEKPVQQYFLKIDPATSKFEMKPFFNISDELNKKYKDNYSTKIRYKGTIQLFNINDDETFTLVYEEWFVARDAYDDTYEYSGNVLVTKYTSEGDVASASFVPKMYKNEVLSFKLRNEKPVKPYKSFFYVNGITKPYLLINDTERNNDVKRYKNIVKVEGIKASDAFYYITGKDVFPGRDYVFGKQPKGHLLASFGTSNYNRETNTLVTFKLSPDDDNVKVIWLKPE